MTDFIFLRRPTADENYRNPVFNDALKNSATASLTELTIFKTILTSQCSACHIAAW